MKYIYDKSHITSYKPFECWASSPVNLLKLIAKHEGYTSYTTFMDDMAAEYRDRFQLSVVSAGDFVFSLIDNGFVMPVAGSNTP